MSGRSVTTLALRLVARQHVPTKRGRQTPEMRLSYIPGSTVEIKQMRAVERLVKLWRDAVQNLADPYRPELHYMRGPGPRWAEKHGSSQSE